MVQRHLAEVCAGAAAVTLADYETDAAGAVDIVVERARALISQALEALDVVAVLYGDLYGELLEPGETGELLEPGEAGEPPAAGGAEAPHEGAAEPVSSPESAEIADAVVLARMGLRHRLRALRELGERATRWERLSAVGSALGTIQTSLNAVDRAMARAEHIPPSLRFYESAVEGSLVVRRRYVALHRLIVQKGPPTAAEARPRLRLIGNAIARMLGLQGAIHLRPGDRALLMMSHAKVREWLAHHEDDAAHVSAGLRMWQELVNISTMFLNVSKREELVQHDARLVREALRQMPAAADDAAARGALVARLSAMAGRSPSLDALLEAPPEAVDPGELRRVLEDLDRQLSGVDESVETAPPASGARSSRWA